MANCVVCGKEFNPKKKGHICCCDVCRVIHNRQRCKLWKRQKRQGMQRGDKNGETLCWHCVKATKDVCAWMRHGRPIDGWNAEETKIANPSGEKLYFTDSYRVISCPEFERG